MRVRWLLVCLTLFPHLSHAQKPPPVLEKAAATATSEQPPGLAAALVPALQVPRLSSARSRQLIEDERLAGELARIENEVSLIKAQADLAAGEARLRSLRGDSRAPAGLPTLVGITGTLNRLTAKLLYEGQHVLYGRVGDVLPSGYELKSLTTTRVVLRKGDESVNLPLLFIRQSPGATPAPATLIPVDSAGPVVGRAAAGGRP